MVDSGKPRKVRPITGKFRKATAPRVFVPFSVGVDTDTVQVTVKTLLSHLVTREFNSSTNSLRAP
eukprot:234452-Prorocentrum_minimum.AAC.1